MTDDIWSFFFPEQSADFKTSSASVQNTEHSFINNEPHRVIIGLRGGMKQSDGWLLPDPSRRQSIIYGKCRPLTESLEVSRSV